MCFYYIILPQSISMFSSIINFHQVLRLWKDSALLIQKIIWNQNNNNFCQGYSFHLMHKKNFIPKNVFPTGLTILYVITYMDNILKTSMLVLEKTYMHLCVSLNHIKIVWHSLIFKKKWDSWILAKYASA